MTFLNDAWYYAAMAEEVSATPFVRRTLDRPVLLAQDDTGKARGVGQVRSSVCAAAQEPAHRQPATVARSFQADDESVIAACQSDMAGREFSSLTPIYLETDFAGTQCGRALAALTARKAAGKSVQSSTNQIPILTE